MAEDTILVVDDESDLVHGLRRTIAMEIDCRVLIAENGLQALEILSSEATDDHLGMFDQANPSSIFLDEIGT